MAKLVIAGGLLVVALLVFCGLYVFWKGARNVQMAMASVKWPKTAGVVVYSKTSREVTRATRRTKSSVILSTKTVIQHSVEQHCYRFDCTP